MTSKAKRMKSYAINLAAIAALYAVMVLLINVGVINDYWQGIFIMVFINIILATSLNLATGFLGQLALGHAGFMAVGAYAAAIFSKAVTMPPLVELISSLLVGGIVAAIFGIIIGVPALRLKGDYLAIITLGFGEIIRVIIENLKITGGAQGLIGIERHTNIYNVFIIAIIIVALLYSLIRSRHGRAIISIREDEIAAEASGIPTTYYKILGFTLAAFIAGIAGGLYAHYMGNLGAKYFDFNQSINILVIVVLGGLGSFTGSIVAAIVLTLLPELLRGLADKRMLVYSIVLILMMIFKPSGLFGQYEFSLTRTIDKAFGRHQKGGVKQ